MPHTDPQEYIPLLVKHHNKQSHTGLWGLVLITTLAGGYMMYRGCSHTPPPPPISAPSDRLNIINSQTREKLDYLHNHDAIDTQTYTSIFSVMYELAERNPDIIHHFGPRVQQYLDDLYLNRIISNKDHLPMQ